MYRDWKIHNTAGDLCICQINAYFTILCRFVFENRVQLIESERRRLVPVEEIRLLLQHRVVNRFERLDDGAHLVQPGDVELVFDRSSLRVQPAVVQSRLQAERKDNLLKLFYLWVTAKFVFL